MKKNIFNPEIRKEIQQRILLLRSDSRPKWGKLTAPQMARHLAEACRIGLGEIHVPDQSNFITRSLVKWLFLANVKPPGREKGKIQTFPQVDVVALGISVADTEAEINNYLNTVDRLIGATNLSSTHPLFGKMNRDDWGLLTYAHADYHLTQFNL